MAPAGDLAHREDREAPEKVVQHTLEASLASPLAHNSRKTRLSAGREASEESAGLRSPASIQARPVARAVRAELAREVPFLPADC